MNIYSNLQKSLTISVFLTKGQGQKLFELSKSATVSQKTKDRATVIRLSAIGWKV